VTYHWVDPGAVTTLCGQRVTDQTLTDHTGGHRLNCVECKRILYAPPGTSPQELLGMKTTKAVHYLAAEESGTRGATPCGQSASEVSFTNSVEGVTCPFCRDKLRLEPRQLPPPQVGVEITRKELDERLAAIGSLPPWRTLTSGLRHGIVYRFGANAGGEDVFTGIAWIDGRWRVIHEVVT
jgi:hypothetical protein